MRAALAVVLTAFALVGCSLPVDPVPQDELEDQVAALYESDDGAQVRAQCDGDLEAEVDARQDCQLQVGDDQRADVRVRVTEVDGDDVSFEATPFVTAAGVASTIETSLSEQGFEVDEVTCDEALMGVVDEETTCTLTPSAGDGAVTATVTSVDGLLVNFTYSVGS